MGEALIFGGRTIMTIQSKIMVGGSNTKTGKSFNLPTFSPPEPTASNPLHRCRKTLESGLEGLNQGDDITGTAHAVGSKVAKFHPSGRVTSFHAVAKPWW
jgi:hypothetical protein